MTNFNHHLIGRNSWEVPVREEATIDLRRYNFFTPVGLSFLAGLINAHAQKCYETEVQFPNDSDVLNYLERINFFQYIEDRFADRINILPGRPAIRRHRYKNLIVEFRGIDLHLSTFEEESKTLFNVTAARVKHFTHMDYIQDIYGELIENALIHSDFDEAQVMAQTYRDCLKISISDHGIGIPERLQEKFGDQYESDGEAIVLATEKEITTRNDRYGTGLTMLRGYMEDPADYLFIASNNGCVMFKNNNQVIVNTRYNANFTGTYIEICLKRDSTRRAVPEEDDLPF